MLGWINKLAPAHRNALPHFDRIYYIRMCASNARHGNTPQTMHNVGVIPTCYIMQSLSMHTIRTSCDKVTIEMEEA